MRKRLQPTRDGVEILNRLYGPISLRILANAMINSEIASAIFELRERAGLTQKQLARRIGTTASVISRIEDADYSGHSLRMLQRICAALDQHLEIHFVPNSPRARRKSA